MMAPGVKTVLVTLLVLTLGATAASYYRYIILNDIPFVTEGFSLEEE